MHETRMQRLRRVTAKPNSAFRVQSELWPVMSYAYMGKYLVIMDEEGDEVGIPLSVLPSVLREIQEVETMYGHWKAQ